MSGVLPPGNQVKDRTGVTDKVVEEVLAGKHPPGRKTHCSTLEAHEEIHIFILVDIMQDVVESVAQKRLGRTGTCGMDWEGLQGWLLKFGDDRKKLCISVEPFVG